MKKFLLVCFSIVFVASVAWAQERVVSGKVASAEDGTGLPGVNVVLKGTTNGTVTDADGNYKLNVPSSGGSLVFSFIGLTTSEVAIGDKQVVDIQLGLDVKQLTEVVVTAQGIVREKRALGYAVTTIGDKMIAERPEADVSRILQGKVPGVNITSTGGVSGTGTNITIRGYSTLTGSNQPLWVVDGVPFNSSTNQENGFSTGGVTTSSRMLDLDPNNIESVSVLKGLSATVLYGDQGRNGVILVTTKSGSSKRRPAQISITQSVFQNTIASAPEYQNNYGGGFHQNVGFFFSNWGPNFNEIDSVDHPINAMTGIPAIRNQFPEFHGKRTSYEVRTNPIDAFFRKGLVSNTSVALSGASDKAGYNASVGYTNEEGFTPGNTLVKYNFGLGFNGAVSDKVTINSSFTFARTDMETPPLNSGFGSNSSNGIPSMFANIFYTPRSVDLANLPFETPVDKRSVYFRSGNDISNPFWLGKYTKNTSLTNRFFNSSSLNYDINQNFSLTYRVGLDTYSELQTIEINKGGTHSATLNGLFRSTNISNTIWNHDIIAAFNKEINEDITLTAKLGANARNDYYEQNGVESINQLAFGLFRHQNFQITSNRESFQSGPLNRSREEQRYGVYGDVHVDYRQFLYVNLSGRNDWTSTVEDGNNTIFYPGASVSFIPTTAFSGLESSTLNFLKVRAGIGSSAGFPNPYNTRSVLAQNGRGLANSNGNIFANQTVANFLGNPNLLPELHQELELGVESKMFNQRLSLDLSLYTKDTKDLITTTPLDPSTGYTSTTVNIGKIRNKGIEATVTGAILQMSNGLTWDATFNFGLYRTDVIELQEGLDEVVVAGFTTLGNFAIVGRPFNIIKGLGIQKDANGNRIVQGSGDYLPTTEIVEIGDPNPEWTSSLINTVGWKGISLSFMFEYRHGGKVQALTPTAMVARGVTKDTDWDRNRTFILPGVKEDGTTNDIQITAANYFFGNYFFTDEAAMWDATTIRLREASLGYALPKNVISKTPFKGVSISLSGSNLWFNAVNTPKYSHFDTDVLSTGVGNGLGFDFLTGPSSRRMGGTLKLTF